MTSESQAELATSLENLGDGLLGVCRALASMLRERKEKRQAGAPRPKETSATGSTPEPIEARLLTVKQFAQEYPAFSEGRLRWLLFNRQWNRFEEAVVQVGRSILIDTKKFHQWLALPNEERQARPRPL